MKKPNIEYVYADYDSPSLFFVNGLHLDVDEIKDNYEDLIDALIKARRCYQGVGDFETCGEMMSQIIPEIDNALKKAGCTE